jgi:hypothetical protein
MARTIQINWLRRPFLFDCLCLIGLLQAECTAWDGGDATPSPSAGPTPEPIEGITPAPKPGCNREVHECSALIVFFLLPSAAAVIVDVAAAASLYIFWVLHRSDRKFHFLLLHPFSCTFPATRVKHGN